MSGQIPAPIASHPRKDSRYTKQETAWVPEPFWMLRLPGIEQPHDHRTRHYMNYAIPTPYRPTELVMSALNTVFLSVGPIRCMAERTEQVQHHDRARRGKK
jgi:hypothetical protein